MQIFLAGFLGGTSPTLAMAGGYAASGSIPPLAAGVSAAIFGLLGGIVAHYTSGKEKREAFIAGVAAPGIISSLIAGVTDGKNTKLQNEQASSLLFSLSAYAQEVTEPQFDASVNEFKTITIDTEIRGGLPASSSLEISGNILGDTGSIPIAVLPVAPGVSSISVPENLSEIIVDGQVVNLDSSNSIRVSIETSPTFWGDVSWGFGGNRRFEIESVIASPN